MTTSLPSKEIYAVDVPEVLRFSAEFRYNFFTPDESVSDTGGVPIQFLSRDAEDVNSSFIQYAVTRAPRMVTFQWKVPRLIDAGNLSTDLAVRNLVFPTNVQNGSLISDNIDKVVSEDHFAMNNFVATTFHDGEIDDKVHYLVSGSYALHTYDEQNDNDNSGYKASQKLSTLTPKSIKSQFLMRSLVNPTRAAGLRFFDKDGKRIFNKFFRRMKNVATNAQMNSKLYHDMTNRLMKEPTSTHSIDVQNLLQYTKKLKQEALKFSTSQVSDNDYKTTVPYVDLKVRSTAFHHDGQAPVIVGYIIDKYEVSKAGATTKQDPIIIDDPNVTLTADFRVRYNTTYAYAIRSVALFTLPAIDEDTGDIAMIKVLISSKPSNKVYINTIETTAPPPPADFGFTWDYERINPTTAKYDVQTGLPYPGTGVHGSMMLHWTFPPNQQRDIKKFQVFRRKNINCPFELIKVYDFDDSVLRFVDKENPDPTLVETLTTPCTYYFDDEFYVGNTNNHDSFSNPKNDKNHHPGSSTYIYAVCSVDAHGYTSAYSAQFEVWFDQFSNKLQHKLISHAGAPKPYPNLYLEADTFVDTMKVSGPDSKRLKVIFNPEFYYVYDNEDKLQPVLSTIQKGGGYKLQFINLDNQKSALIDITIDDQNTGTSTKTTRTPEFRFGKKKLGKLRRYTSK